MGVHTREEAWKHYDPSESTPKSPVATDGDERSVIRCGSTFGHWLGNR